MYNSDMAKIKRKYAKRRLTRARAIKLYCKEMCCAGDFQSWKECSFTNCFLYSFRLGRETLGNQTSFKKQRHIPLESPKTSVLQATSTPKSELQDRQEVLK